MTYFKCASCKARLYSAARHDDLIDDLCPECGSVLEPAGELAELVGYRSITPPSDPERLADPRAGVVTHRFGEVLAVRRAREAQALLDADRWLDDGGNVNAAVLPVPPEFTLPLH